MAHKINVAILGAGNWGTVLSLLAARSHNSDDLSITLFDRDPDRIKEIEKTRINKRYLPDVKLPKNIQCSSSLAEVINEHNVLIISVPSLAMREFCRSFAPLVHSSHIILHGTKGLEPETFLRMSEVITQETGCLRVGTISGPNIAQELAEELPGATVLASRFDEVAELGKEIFQGSLFQVSTSNDLQGVEYMGTFKNILALISGFCFELKLGQNATAEAITYALSEIQILLKSLGGNADTVFGLAGFGDIFATSTSPNSRNFKAGQRIAKGMSQKKIEEDLDSTVEGINTLGVISQFAENHDLKIPTIVGFKNLLLNESTSKARKESFLTILNK